MRKFLSVFHWKYNVSYQSFIDWKQTTSCMWNIRWDVISRCLVSVRRKSAWLMAVAFIPPRAFLSHLTMFWLSLPSSLHTPARAHSCFLSWLCICLHDTETKCRAGASNSGVNSPRLLYRSENFTPVRNFVTVSCKCVRCEVGLPVDYNG